MLQKVSELLVLTVADIHTQMPVPMFQASFLAVVEVCYKSTENETLCHHLAIEHFFRCARQLSILHGSTFFTRGLMGRKDLSLYH